MTSAPAARTSRILRLAFKLLVAGGGLFLAFRVAPPAAVWSHLRQADPGLVGLCLGLLVARVPLAAVRWSVLLSSAGRPAEFAFLHRAYWVGMFFNTILPGALGGDVARVLLLGRRGPGYAAATGSVLAERLLGLAALACIPLAAFRFLPPPLAARPEVRAAALAAALVVVGAGMALLLLGQGLARLRWPEGWPLAAAVGWLRGMAGSGGGAKALALGFLLSAAFQAVGVAAAMGLFVAVGSAAPPAELLFCLPVAFLAATLPVSINGLGVREGVLVYLLGLAGQEPGRTLSAAALWLASTLALGLAGGAVSLLRPGREARDAKGDSPA